MENKIYAVNAETRFVETGDRLAIMGAQKLEPTSV